MPSLMSKIERVPVDSLEFFPGNPRRGNVAVIADSLRENQQYSPLVVQQATRRVLAGNHTLRAAKSLGWEEIDVVMVDVDDRQARKILLSANRTADLATDDAADLAALLQEFDAFDLGGTGYDETDLDKLLAKEDNLPEPGDAAEDDLQLRYGVVIDCSSEEEQIRLLEKLTADGLSVRALML